VAARYGRAATSQAREGWYSLSWDDSDFAVTSRNCAKVYKSQDTVSQITLSFFRERLKAIQCALLRWRWS
jgi:hypothetical protein